MFIFPDKSHHVVLTSLSPEACEQLLRDHLYIYHPFHWSGHARRPLIGHVSSDGFLIHKRSMIPSLFAPYAKGTFEWTGQQTKINMLLCPRYGHVVLTLITFVAFTLVTLIALFPGLKEVQQSGPIALIPLFGFLLFGLTVLAMGNLAQLLMARRHLRSLRRILGDLFEDVKR